MKHAAEVIDLLAAYPGRQFRMAEIVRHVARGCQLPPRERNAMRKSAARVLNSLEESGMVRREVPVPKSAVYVWQHVELREGRP